MQHRHRSGWVILMMLSLGALGAGAWAQRGGFQGLGMGGGANLLGIPAVQAELKLTDAQKTQVTEMAQKLRQNLQGLAQRLQSATAEERGKILAELQAANRKAVDSILNDDQKKRFREITLQQQGMTAVATPDVAGELKLTDEQKSKIQAVQREQQAAISELFQGGGDPAAAREKFAALRKQTEEKIAAILTDDQKAQWKSMLGAPFTLPPRPRQ